MQVSVEKTSDLERKVSFEIPAEKINSAVESRLQELSRTVRLNGFRPGKVPLSVVRKRFGDGVRQEVLGEQVESGYREAVTRESLQPVGAPQVDNIDDNAEGGAVTVTARVEVYPEFEVADLSSQTLTRAEGEIRQADLDAMISHLRKQRREWSDVQRAAQAGDRLTVDFTGTIDGEAFEGGKAEDFQIELGTNQLIDGFESGLTGLSAGDKKDLDLQFPDDYRATEVAGKPVQFAVEVKAVAEPVEPALDAEFFKGFGVDSGKEEDFLTEVRANMQREMDEKLRSRVRASVMELLSKAHPITVPAQLVEQEITSLQSAAADQAVRGGGAAEGVNLPREIFEKQARERVLLGLVLNRIAEHAELSPDEARVRERVEGLASSYEEPQQVIDYYLNNQEMMDSLRSSVFEDQVIDWVLDQVQIKTETLGFSEIVEPAA